MKGKNVQGTISIWAAPDRNGEIVLMWQEQGGSIQIARSILTITLERNQTVQDARLRPVVQETLKKPLLEKPLLEKPLLEGATGGPIFVAINDEEC